jgi:signal transduction histidine kinase
MGGSRAVTLAVVVAGIATVVVALNPHFRVASGEPQLQAALGMAASLVALLAAFLAFGRLQRLRRLTDFALACALGVIALSNLFFGTVPTLAGLAGSSFLAWSALISRTLGCMLFAVAAFVPSRRIRHIGRAEVTAVASMTGGLVLLVLLGWLYAARLPVAVTSPPPIRSPGPPSHAAPGLVALELLTAVLAALAVIGYLRRSRRLHDTFFGWLAIAAVFGSAAHLNYFLYPLFDAGVFSIADAFRLFFYAVLLAGSMREIWSYWLALSEAMVVSERRRIACDLHDGLAQELAYLTRNLDSLDGNVEQETLSGLRHATGRARLESRLAISRLTAVDRPAVGTELADAVREAAKQFGVGLDLDLLPDVQLPTEQSDALVRIACEAVTNAARHSGARRVSLSLERRRSRVRLRVSDSGSGFDLAGPAGGFGLTSMRERASSVGGDLKISSIPGHGTEVEVMV